MSYPASLDSFTTKTNKVDLVDAAHINAAQTSIVAIETAIGLNPKGSAADLATRLLRNILADGSLNHGTSFPGSPNTGDWFFRTSDNVAYVWTGSTWSAQSGLTAYSAGDYQIFGPSDFKSSTATSYTKLIEVYLPRGGTLRTKMYAASNNGGATHYCQIYRNGSALGTEQTYSTINSIQTFSEDIAGWAAGDLLQVYVKTSDVNYFTMVALELYENVPGQEISKIGGRAKASSPKIWNSADLDLSPISFINNLGNPGDIFMRPLNGGASLTFYIKTATSTWTAK